MITHWNSPQHPLCSFTDGSRAPVNRVFCIAKNYEAHAIEMGGEVDRQAPFHFQKSFDAVTFGPDVCYPSQTSDLHHEVELVVMLKDGGRDLSVPEARGLIVGYAVGIDFTRRDRQAEAKQQGRPWEIGKNFDQSAVLGVFSPAEAFAHRSDCAITLAVNGEDRQAGQIGQMVYSPEELIVHLSRLQTLKAGDLIFTGTPSGVGPVVVGDQIEAAITGLTPLSCVLCACNNNRD